MRSQRRVRTPSPMNQISETKQCHKDECDINLMLKKYAQTGEINQAQNITPVYGDFTDITDFQTAHNTVIAARETFMQLPAKIRSEFDNDPAKYCKFIEDPKNREMAKQLGMLKPTEAPNPLTSEPPNPENGTD